MSNLRFYVSRVHICTAPGSGRVQERRGHVSADGLLSFDHVVVTDLALRS